MSARSLRRGAAILLVFSRPLAAGCYSINPSAGGGQTRVGNRYVSPGDVALPPATASSSSPAADVPHRRHLRRHRPAVRRRVRLLLRRKMDDVPPAPRRRRRRHHRHRHRRERSLERRRFRRRRVLHRRGRPPRRRPRPPRLRRRLAQDVVLDNLPSLGDRHTNGPVVGPDGWIYFGQGTATSSGVVGPDNAKMGWLRRHPTFHDIPARDVKLAGHNFTSDNPLTNTRGDQATTAYLPYGTPSLEGQVILGQTLCTGAVLRVRPRRRRRRSRRLGLTRTAWPSAPTGGCTSPRTATTSATGRSGAPATCCGRWTPTRRRHCGTAGPTSTATRPSPRQTTTAPPFRDRGPKFLLAEHPNEPPAPW